MLQRYVIKTDHLHHKRRDELVRQWEEAGGDVAEDRMTLLKMARHERHPPCLLARIGRYSVRDGSSVHVLLDHYTNAFFYSKAAFYCM